MAGFEWPSSTTEAILAYAARIQSEALIAANEAINYLHERTVVRAKLSPEWEPLADHIEVWSSDGMLEIGVRDDEYVSLAFALEYGDEVRPPQPLFRTMNIDLHNAGQKMNDHMNARFSNAGMF